MRVGAAAMGGDVDKDKFIQLYAGGASLELAAKKCGVTRAEVIDQIMDDMEFSDRFRKATETKAMIIRQKFIDNLDEISDSIIESAKSGKSSSVSAARLAFEMASMSAPGRVSRASAPAADAEASEPESYDGELEDIAKGIR